MSVPAAGRIGVRRRPKDRKDQIVEAARQLIVQRGYRNVSMAEIAEAVGITAGALYRHFSNKAVLLGAVIDKSFDDVIAASSQCEMNLGDVLAMACEQVVTQRDTGALWWRESRYLEPDTAARLRSRLHDNNRTYQTLIQAERPALPSVQAQRLAWGVQSILASPSFHTSKLPHADFVALLSAACRSVCTVELGPRPAAPAPPSRRNGVLEPVSKRESLLTHAITLFERNGFEATSLNEIGTAAGVTGPNLYSYFVSKADILETATSRGVSALWLLLNRVLRENDEPAKALDDLVRGYIELALERTVLASLLLSEQQNVDDVTRNRQREYVAEWVALLRASRPAIDEPSARVLVHTALAVIHTMAQIGPEHDDPTFADDLAAMATAVLFSHRRHEFGSEVSRSPTNQLS
jgi:AcrR family transcriptional regulator